MPEDWICVSLGDIGEYSKGKGISRSDAHTGIIPAIRYGEIYTDHHEYIKSFRSFISKDVAHSSVRLQQDQILFTCSGETKEDIAKAVAFLGNERAYVGGDIIILTPKIDCDSLFLGFACNTPEVNRQKSEVAQGDAVVHISMEALKKIRLLLPPVSEQHTIADILKNMDALIAELDKLIAKKRLIKQGTMQQLLTGRTRLKGFDEPWQTVMLGKIGFTYNGLVGKTKDDFGIGSAKYITFLNVLDNPILDANLFESVNVAEEEYQNKARKGDLFFNTSSETPDEVGFCAMLDVDFNNLYLNSFCFGYRVTSGNVLPLFLAYFFRSRQGRRLMSLLAQGVTRYNISKKAFLNTAISLPQLSEQYAIASILSDMDTEVSELEKKKAKYEKLKHGMMQQLLTGRIRLV